MNELITPERARELLAMKFPIEEPKPQKSVAKQITSASTAKTMSNKTYEFHDLCSMFPMLPKVEFTLLVEDIKANGLKQPILLLKEKHTEAPKIIDGRNRYMACQEAGVNPAFEVINVKNEDPIALVRSFNLSRRHLTESQRAKLAADLQEMSDKLTDAQAAAETKTSVRQVQRAKKVKKKGTKAVNDSVQSGDLSLGAAEDIIELPKEDQDKAVSDKKGAKKTAAKIRAAGKKGKEAAKKGQAAVDELPEAKGGLAADAKKANASAAKIAAGDIKEKILADLEALKIQTGKDAAYASEPISWTDFYDLVVKCVQEA